MAAIGWYVGLVHYPAFLRISPDQWREFHQLHTQFTGLLVIGPMLLQVAATVMLFWAVPKVSDWVLWGSVVCLLLSFGYTLVVSGPIHGQMAEYDRELIEQLINTNWPRCVAWTIQAGLAGFALVQSINVT